MTRNVYCSGRMSLKYAENVKFPFQIFAKPL